jgi:hypothetical protein
MKIIRFGFGNEQEAFIEDRFKDGLNVIFSNDNNKGKTLVFQGMMYSIGYESIFPNTFNKKNIFFYLEMEIESKRIEFLRKNNSIIVKKDNGIIICSSIGEFKYFFNNEIFRLPKIYKDSKLVTIDLSLLYEIFFIGQDNRAPSNLISKGRFNKSDFKQMILSFSGNTILEKIDIDISEIESKIKEKNLELKNTTKKIGIIKKEPNVAEMVSVAYDSISLNSYTIKLKELHNDLLEFRKSREREINRKIKLENLILELKSLNRDLSEGNVVCGECGSDKIIYINNDISFDVSNKDVRNNIIESIKIQIQNKIEIIDGFNYDINKIQSKISSEVKSTPASVANILLYKEIIDEGYDNDNIASNIKSELINLNSMLDQARINNSKAEVKNDQKLNSIINLMNELMRKLDPSSNIIFDDIFTKRDSTYSGSEEQEFYFCKIIALNNILQHCFPIIIDSFRDGEISTDKELIMLDKYSNLNKQVIISSTLKNEEYDAKKYKDLDMINSIDYSSHSDSKILSEEYLVDFKNIIRTFNVDI